MITPAISVLSAVEGLEVIQPGLAEFVLPITIVILIRSSRPSASAPAASRSFSARSPRYGSSRSAISGVVHIVDGPAVLWALNPFYAVRFLFNHAGLSLVVIGAVFLAVTGAEALYADLGHFGRRPILFAWYALVFPCLVLNYFGQGAFVLAHPRAWRTRSSRCSRPGRCIPVVILATMATVIASQAVISGAYSLTKQASSSTSCRGCTSRHTSENPARADLHAAGQLGAARRRDPAGARLQELKRARLGLRLRGDRRDGVTDVILLFVMWRVWQWQLRGATWLVVPFLVVDMTFLAANGLKIFEGAWVAIGIGAVMLLLMVDMDARRALLFEKTRKTKCRSKCLTNKLEQKPPTVVPGTAVFLTGDPQSAPTGTAP